MSVARPTIVPILVPHGFCLPGCPYCPVDPAVAPGQLLLDPTAVSSEIDRVLDRRLAEGLPPEPVEIGFYGGDLWQLPRGPRTDLLDAAEWEVRRGRAVSIRITASPLSVLRAPLTEFRSRGVRAIELPLHSCDDRVLRSLGVRRHPKLGLEAIGRLNRARFRAIVHLTPGLPGSSHRSSIATVESVVRAGPDAARILPAMVLEGTGPAQAYLRGTWQPMKLSEAVSTSRHMLERLRRGGVEVIRLGLRPEADLLEGPPVLAGPDCASLRIRVESEVMRATATAALRRAFSLGTREFTLVVQSKQESYLRGLCNENLRILGEQFRLDRLVVVPLPEQPAGEIRVFPGEVLAVDVPPLPPKRVRKAS